MSLQELNYYLLFIITGQAPQLMCPGKRIYKDMYAIISSYNDLISYNNVVIYQ